MIDIRDIIGDVPFKIAQEQNVAWVKNALEKHNGLDDLFAVLFCGHILMAIR